VICCELACMCLLDEWRTDAHRVLIFGGVCVFCTGECRGDKDSLGIRMLVVLCRALMLVAR